MFTSKFTRLAHVAEVAACVAYTIHIPNVETVKFVVSEFAPSRNKEEAKTDDALDEIEDGLTDAEKAAADDQALVDGISDFWKNYLMR